MTLPRLIVFCGFAFAGKDAAADQFVKNDNFVKTYMSKPLERALLTLDPWIADYEKRSIERYSKIHAEIGYDESKKIPEVRRLLQTLGTEVGRKQFDEDLWVKLAEREVSSEIRNGKNVCLTGVRYPNEMSMVEQFGGVTVWIHRPGIEPVNSHSSEHTIGPSDCLIQIHNDETPEVMYGRVKALMLWEGVPKDQKNFAHCVYDRVDDNYVCVTHNEIVKHNVSKGWFDPVRIACSQDTNQPKG